MTVAYPDLGGDFFPKITFEAPVGTCYKYLKALVPLKYEFVDPIMKTEFETGVEVRRRLVSSPRFRAVINYAFYPYTYKYKTEDPEDPTKEIIVYTYVNPNDLVFEWNRFYYDVKGPLYPFMFFFKETNHYYRHFCGTVTEKDQTRLYTPISWDSYDYTLILGESTIRLYKNGGEEISVYFDQLEADFDSGRLVIVVPTMVEGDTYSVSFTGRLGVWARLASSVERSSEIQDCYSKMRVELVGVEPSLHSGAAV